MIEKAVIDAQVLLYFHYDYQKIPPILQELKKKVIKGEITVILPTIAIAELLWKMRRAGKIVAFKEALLRWENSENVIIDSFNLETIKLMLKNAKSHELHDEIIAMTCKKHGTNIIYSTDSKFKEIFNLQLRSW
ncbi:MAG: PIN domain-containing protein [Promethearchaeota archaeon]|nr:MAG: PIN domain-containing protein [Candidatus Lokiarchaeota archaeon]